MEREGCRERVRERDKGRENNRGERGTHRLRKAEDRNSNEESDLWGAGFLVHGCRGQIQQKPPPFQQGRLGHDIDGGLSLS